MQPLLTQVPPSSLRSMSAVFRPSLVEARAQRRAGLAGTDDDRIEALWPSSQHTSGGRRIAIMNAPDKTAHHKTDDAFHQLIHQQPHVGVVGDREPDDAASAAAGHSHQWKWSLLKEVVKQSATAVPVGDERRAMQLFNPGLNGQWATTNTLIAAVQVLLPGEVARAHRHSPAAIRFIIEGDGAYTAVEGEKVIMRPGDFILTPSWQWHDHGNETRRRWCGWTASTCRSPRR